MSDWGKGVNNDIGWGQGANNDIGYGSIYADSNSGETLLLKDNTAFIIEVKTDNAGTSNDNQFQFTGAEGDYDVIAKQNDIIVQTFNDLSGEETITFANGAGTYILEVTPKEVNPFNQIIFANGGDKEKMKDIKQWGNIVWADFNGGFFGCVNMLVSSTDIPNLTNCSVFQNMFLAAPLANPDVSKWDMTNATSIRNMFFAASSANPDCRNWNVINITSAENAYNKSNLSTENLTAIYENWSLLNVQNNVPFGAGNTKYNASGQAGRDILVNTYNWTVADGGQV